MKKRMVQFPTMATMYETDGNGDPNVGRLQPWDSNEEEGSDISFRGVEDGHTRI